MQVRFTARGNFRPLETSLRGLNQQMNRSVGGFGRMAAVNVTNPMNDMVTQIDKGKLGFRGLGDAVRNQGKYIREHNALMNSTARIYRDNLGNARVFMDVNRNSAQNMATLGQRLAHTNNAMNAFGRSTIAAGKNMQWAGRQVMVGLGIPLALLAASSYKAAEEYDKNMTRIIKVNGEAAAAAVEGGAVFDMVSDSIRRQTDGIVELGASMGFLAAETSNMVAEFAQMGFVGAALDQLSEAALRLSRISGTELDTSMELTRITAQAFGVELEDLSQTFAQLNLIENNTALSLDELAQGMPVVAGVAATMGMSIEETGGLMAMMKENGISAKEGATALRTGLLRIVQDATDPAIEAFDKIGMSLTDMQERMAAGTDELEGGDVMIFFDELSDRLNAMGEDQAQLNEFAAAISKMVGVRSSARFLTFLKEVGDRHDENTVAGRAWLGVLTDAEEAMRIYNFEQEQIEKSAAGIAERLRAELNVELVKLGQNFLDVANKAREIAIAALAWFNNLDRGTRNMILGVAAAGAALGTLTMIAGVLTNAFGQVMTIFSSMLRLVLPKFTMLSTGQHAVTKAYMASTAAINAENTALATNAALKGKAAAAATGLAASKVANLAGSAGAAGAGALSAAAPRAGLGAASGAGTRGFGAIGAKGAGGIVNTGPLAMVGKVLATVGKIVAGIAAAKGIILAIIGALVAIPILSNPQAFLSGFRDSIQGPMEGFQAAWGRVQESVQRIIALFQDAGGEGSGLARMSEILGNIAGILGGVILTAVEAVANAFGIIADAVEFVLHLVEGISLIFTDWDGAMSAFHEAWLALGRVIAGAIAMIMDGIAGILESVSRIVPGAQAGADALRGWADELRNSEHLASNISTLANENEQLTRRIADAQEAHSSALRESNEYLDEMQRAGINIRGMTEEQILANELITDEMKAQAIAALRRLEIEKQIADLRAKMARLDDYNQMEGVARMRQREHMLRIETEIKDLLEKSPELHNDVMNEITGSREAAQWLDDTMDDVDSSIYDAHKNASKMKDSLDGSNPVLDRLEKKAADLRDRIQESERAAQEWASTLESEMSSAINDIAASVINAFEAQIKKQEDAFDRREERLESHFEAERKRIDDTADRRLKAIDEQQEAEEKAEEARKRFFEQEKARIEYIKGLKQDNVDMEEAMARGNLGEASKIRIGLQSKAEAFMLDSYERERQKFQDAKKDEFEAEREKIRKIQEQRNAAMDQAEKRAFRQLEVERNAASAAAAARRRSIELYLEDWKRITPATEAEFRRHMADLTRNMNGFGIDMRSIATQYSQDSGRNIRAAFTNAVNDARAVIAERGKWRNVGQRSGEAFRAGLALELRKVERDIEQVRKGQTVNAASGGGGNIYSNTPRAGSGGVSSSTPTSRFGLQAMTNAYHSITPRRATHPGSSYGMGPFDSMAGARAPVPAYHQPRTTGGVFHDGGKVGSTGRYEGLKRDETPAVLQHGEYVIKRDSVKTLGKGYLDMINNVSKYHDGGLVDYSQTTVREGGALGAMTGYAGGKLATLGAADILSGMGVDPSIKRANRAKTSGESIGKAAGKQIAEVVEASQFSVGMGEGAGWAPGAGAGGWPPRRWATLSPNTRGAQNFWQGRANFPGGIGSGVHRGVAASDHSWGKALDFMVAPLGRMPSDSQRRVGWEVANWHIANPGAFGTKYVIWDKMINSGDSRGWRDYTRYGPNPGPTLGHYDHVHVSYLHDGGMVMPSMRGGGKVKMDNTIANLHKGERVLTEPSTKALERAVQNFANGQGGGNSYHFEINVDGGNIDEKELARTIRFEFEKRERANTRRRRVG